MKPYCGARIAHSLGKPIIHWFHSFHRPPDVLFKSFVVFMIVSTIFVNMATRPQNTIVEPEVRTLPTTTDCSVSYIGVHLLGVGEGGGQQRGQVARVYMRYLGVSETVPTYAFNANNIRLFERDYQSTKTDSLVASAL